MASGTASRAPSEAEWLGVVRVVVKLLAFSVLLVLSPTVAFITSQGGHLDSLFAITFGVPTDSSRVVYSGLLAILATNTVVIAYTVVAFRETPYAASVGKGAVEKKQS